MKTHYYNLHDGPFNLIKSGRKTVEMRLFDAKRQKLSLGDTIVFINTTTKETLRVTVKKLKRFSSFTELYANFNKLMLGYLETEVANPRDMEVYYTKNAIKKYGALAITIELNVT